MKIGRHQHVAFSKTDGSPVRAQATIEFCFAMIVVVLLLMGMIQSIVWTAKDLTNRRREHERRLTTWDFGVDQTEPSFYYSTPIGSSVPSNIFGEREF